MSFRVTRMLTAGAIISASLLGASTLPANAWTTGERKLPNYSDCRGSASAQENQFAQTRGYAEWLSVKQSITSSSPSTCNVKFKIWYKIPGNSTTKIWYQTLKKSQYTGANYGEGNGIKMSKVEMKLCKINCGDALTVYYPN